MKESGYTKVYEVISDEYHLSMRTGYKVVDHLCKGDTIFWSTKSIFHGEDDSFMGMYHKGEWIDLSNTHCYFLVSSKDVTVRPKSRYSHVLNITDQAFSLYECIVGNIIKDVTISYRREDKLNQIG